MKLKPLADRVVVKPLEEEDTTKSGIVIPGTIDKERPEKGVIVEVGPGKPLKDGNRQQMEVKVGDTVFFKKYSPDEVKLEKDDKQSFFILEESDILAVLEA